ncbi:MAG: peptidoglycan DD-metalloendopeptidase family protein [Oscillospiraceae bacterium]|nr:peptidoglycan DD-metalloendopeptidase family protein [Oscillospiraceae bacterium]
MIQKKDKKKPDPSEKFKKPAVRRAATAVQQPRRPSRILDYRARRRFPESSNPYRQLQLLLRGSMPLLRQKAGSLAYRFRSFLDRMIVRMRERTPRHQLIQTALFLSAGVAVAAFAAFQALYTTATTLSFEGRELGTVASEEEAQFAVRRVEDSISQVLGSQYSLEPDKVSYTTGLAFRSTLVEEADLEAALSESLRVVEHGYVLYVNGEKIGATQTQGAFEGLLDQVSAEFRSENAISIDFVEGVEIRECDLPVEDFTNLADVALLLNSEKDGEVTYTVKKGDCWSVIAQDNNMTNDDLLRLNPGYDIDKLQIGDELLISNAVPYLTVRAVQMEYYEEEIPYEIEYQDDSSMWEGDTKVISKGQYGKANTEAKVTYEGVTEIEREIISRDIFQEPVTEVQARGTKERPSWAPTGSFRWPVSGGTITSRYGSRKIFGGTSFHGGIDIAKSYGTDVVAADGGEVIYAGWMGSYGYLVQIDHQNGYVTYYAHNSKLLVSVGDKVYKGQHIAEMGSTGRSTGNHCHFEVRYKGERQNPMNYLP